MPDRWRHVADERTGERTRKAFACPPAYLPGYDDVIRAHVIARPREAHKFSRFDYARSSAAYVPNDAHAAYVRVKHTLARTGAREHLVFPTYRFDRVLPTAVWNPARIVYGVFRYSVSGAAA